MISPRFASAVACLICLSFVLVYNQCEVLFTAPLNPPSVESGRQPNFESRADVQTARMYRSMLRACPVERRIRLMKPQQQGKLRSYPWSLNDLTFADRHKPGAFLRATENHTVSSFDAFHDVIFELLPKVVVDERPLLWVADHLELFTATRGAIPHGFWAEFGVFQGASLNYAASRLRSTHPFYHLGPPVPRPAVLQRLPVADPLFPNEALTTPIPFTGPMAGFDSFEGLPVAWRKGYNEGMFNLQPRRIKVKVLHGEEMNSSFAPYDPLAERNDADRQRPLKYRTERLAFHRTFNAKGAVTGFETLHFKTSLYYMVRGSLPTDLSHSSAAQAYVKRQNNSAKEAHLRGVELYPGWFQNTIPLFLQRFPDPHQTPATFIHFDGDLFVSAVIPFTLLQSYIVPGTILCFDELVGYPGYRNDEMLALFLWGFNAQVTLCPLAIRTAPYDVPLRKTKEVDSEDQAVCFQVLHFAH